MKKIILFGIFACLTLYSCEEYIGDVNEEQSNRPYNDALPPNAALAGAINNYQNYQAITLADYGNKLAYVWALNNGFTSNDAAYSYAFTANDYTACFTSAYIFGDNFQDIIDKKSSYPNYEYHFGVSKVFKVMCMDYVTALYGDVPYTQAFNSNIEYPKYDDDKTIIPKLFLELDEAKAYLNTSNPNVVPLGSEDIVFRGDVAEWLKFVNTIELKLLLRLSKTNDPALVALRTARAASIDANQDFVVSNVTVNPGYNATSVGQRNPIFRIHGLNDDFTAWTSTNRANASGDYFVKMLSGTINNSTLTTGVVDPRRARMITTTVGGLQGTFPLTAVSRYAAFYTGRSSNIGVDDANENACSRDSYLMLAAESYFLQAEAMQRGYISGSAQNAFNSGIIASFDFYNKGWGSLASVTPPSNALPPMTVTAAQYISGTNLRNGLGWSGSADKINCIITQKYLALAQWNGIELYLDNQRTSYPVIPMPQNATQAKKPNRLIYPSSEYTSNSQNVPNMSNDDLFSINSKTPYYLQ